MGNSPIDDVKMGQPCGRFCTDDASAQCTNCWKRAERTKQVQQAKMAQQETTESFLKNALIGQTLEKVKTMPSLDEQIEELERTLAERRLQHPRMISTEIITADEAASREVRTEAALITLRRIRREVVG